MSVSLLIRRESPTRLYTQIASQLEFKIATGTIRSGERLPPLRQAADDWGVSLHTVRRAYHELEKSGLVRTEVPTGTIVRSDPHGLDRSLSDFMLGAIRDAERRFSVDRAAVLDAIASLDPDGPGAPRALWVLECSRTLSEQLAGPIGEALGRIGCPWVLDAGAPPEGLVVSTYFHYAQARALMADRPDDLHFVATRLSPALLAAIHWHMEGGDGSAVVLETDAVFAQNLKREVELAAGADAKVEIRTPTDPVADLERIDPGTLVLVSPRQWDRLAESGVERERLVPIAYTVADDELARLSSAVSANGRRGRSRAATGRTLQGFDPDDPDGGGS